MNLLTLYTALLLLVTFCSADYDIVKNTTNGKILGTASPVLGVETYLGIPYAAPPVGELRWKPPKPFPPWRDTGEIRNATFKRSSCPQSTSEGIIGNEDCLFMNVYVPRTPMFELYPVMVFLHPGEFQRDGANNYDGTLLARDGTVIIVTFNYRVGALGFLSTGDNQATGNYGLLDQLAALEWVRDNIKNFQGDPDRVTIFGSAAGAVSALSHAISPKNHGSQKLFHRVISQSGSPFSWWAFQTSPRFHALKMMEDGGCSTFSTAIGLECLKQLDAKDIVNLQLQIVDGIDIPWKPTADGVILTDIPDKMASDPTIIADMLGRYDFLLGSVEYESAFDYSVVQNITDRSGYMSYLQEDLREHFVNAEKMAEAVAFNYIDPVNPPNSQLGWQRLAFDTSRDFGFLVPSLNMTIIASSESGFNSSAYYYLFTHKPSEAVVDAGLAFPSGDIVDGAAHKDEVSYLFGVPLTLPNATAEDRQISLQMMTYWTNFAKSGNPSLGQQVDTEWPEYNWESQKYLQFGSKDPEQNLTTFVKDYLVSNKVVFWTQELGFYEEGKGLDDSIPLPATNDSALNPEGVLEPVVTTLKGQVRGLRLVRDGYILDRFLRIPYAKPPVGFLRFKRTEPHPGWEGILNAAGNRSALEWLAGCPHFNFIRNGSYGNEDCLFLNIYVPGGINATRDQPLPVMVWFHGGAFVWGRGTGLRFYYDMEEICKQGNVIGVTINYRLGPLGFLSTLDEYAPGNSGFLDQVEALRWVQDNIEMFGGDPSRVTIFGESAGAGSVTFHMVSPLSEGLFLRGIAESGSIPAQWTMAYNPLREARELAQGLGCPTDSTKLLVKCLQNKPMDLIVKAGLRNDYGEPKDMAWAGVVDGYFIPDNPRNLVLNSINKDLLIGHNSMDGHLFASLDFPAINIESFPMSREDVTRASSLFGPGVPDYVAEAVAFKYIDWEEPETGLVWPKLAIVSLLTDHMFLVPSYWNANKRAATNGTGRTYMYRFSQKSRFGFLPDWMEADHLAELAYVFGHPFQGRNFSDEDRKLSLAIMTHWTNFAWSGNPNYPNQGDIFATWPEYSLQTKYALDFNTDTANQPETYQTTLSNYRGEIVEFWTDLLVDLWTLPLDVCPTTTSQTGNKNWIHYDKMAHEKAVDCPSENLVQATETGCVRGYEYESNGAIIERYLGIPYAKPPLGTLRFKPPVAAETWSEIYSAKNYSKICPQSSILDDTMSEDCLYLNIYVPQINATNAQGLPVMVWIHGGGFINGNGMEKLKGDTLAALGGVIVVNSNYRLGSFGFMTTDDEYSPGNYGLLDQQFALNWIKNNIANFGGNPGDITIFGNSAGGQSVLLQSLSPTNKNLGVTKAIIESASIIPHDDLKQLDRAISLADAAGCDTTMGNEAMVECLRGISAADLLAAQAATTLKFEPTVDGEFLPVHPRQLAEESEVKKWTYIIGGNSGEGSVRWGDVQTVNGEERFHEVVDLWFDPPYGWRKDIVDQHYADYDDLNFFQNETKMQLHLTQMFGDERYIAPGLEVAEDYTLFGTDVYFYLFAYPHDRPDFYGFPSWAGAAHSAEFSFVWGDVINDDTQSEEVKELSRKIIHYWSNFAKTGNPNTGYAGESSPTPDWPTYKGRGIPGLGAKNYIELDLGNKTQVKQDLRPTEKALWLEHMVSEAKYCEVDIPDPEPTTPSPTVDLDNPEVVTTSGKIAGKREKTELLDVQVFLGVPYAKSPVEDLRFTKAEPVEAWSTTLNAKLPKPPCVQWNHIGEVVIGEEDCLYLDIFVPTGLLSSNSTSMPVLLWIHGDSDGDDFSQPGGSFWSGGGSPGWDLDTPTIDPTYLSSIGGMVVIRPNFRLGPFGFLTTESEGLSGNYGLSDLRQALIWTFENAKNFAGDSEKITVMGQGSGAAAAELLGVLPSTRDYIKRVISSSGSSFAPWAFCTNSECEKVAQSIAEANECQQSSTGIAIRDCLQQFSAQHILSTVPITQVTAEGDDGSNAWGMWRFTADGDIIPNDVTLEDMFASSKTDFITGVMSHEFYNYLKPLYESSTSRATNEGFLLQSILDTKRFLAYSNVETWPNEIYRVISHEYTNWEDRNDQELAFESSTQYYSDLMFAVHSSKSVSSKMKAGSGSFYQYVINRPLSQDKETDLRTWVGGRHGDDIIYTFGTPFLQPSLYSDQDRQFSLSIMSYWANFAWHGDPNNDLSMQTWREYTENRRSYLEMNTEIDLPGTPKDFNLEKNSLWDEVVPVFSPDDNIIDPTLTTKEPFETTTLKECTEEIPPIGTGLGLYLTPEEADTAIYAMFSVSLVLALVLTLIFLHWVCAKRALESKNKQTKAENHYSKEGTSSGLEIYNNITFENEERKEGHISAL